MAKLNERLDLIGTAIRSQATTESKEIIAKANEIRANEMAAYEETLLDEFCTKLQQASNALRLDAVKRIAKAEVDTQRALLLRREELTSSIFAAVRARLREFAASEQYLPWLLEHMKTVQDKYDHTHSILLLRKEDLALQETLAPLLPGCTVQPDETIVLGGFRLRNNSARVLLDKTLDAELEENRPWFLQTCGFSIL